MNKKFDFSENIISNVVFLLLFVLHILLIANGGLQYIMFDKGYLFIFSRDFMLRIC